MMFGSAAVSRWSLSWCRWLSGGSASDVAAAAAAFDARTDRMTSQMAALPPRSVMSSAVSSTSNIYLQDEDGTSRDCATPLEEDRATAIGNMHKNLVKISRVWFERYALGHGQTDTHTQTYSLQYLATAATGEVMIKLRSNYVGLLRIFRQY